MIFDLEGFKEAARKMNAAGSVLLKNDKEALPLEKGAKIALFGRAQMNYYKTGTGSGALVNTAYTIGVREALINEGWALDQELSSAYEAFVADHPFFVGQGWGQEPWFQTEMPVTEELVEGAAKRNDIAIVLIGRTAGEDQDNKNEPGSFLLTEDEENMIALVTEHFEKSVVLLNTGNIIDMTWVEKYDPSAVMYIWHGGQEGGNGVLRLLDGSVSPSGKLADTIAYLPSDYPAYENFGDPDRNFYKEDIFVGYRYFSTFAKERVLYPFGFGLSYTTFAVSEEKLSYAAPVTKDTVFTVQATVKNTGNVPGREVVQIYVSAPQGKLGHASLSLAGWKKTGVIEPGKTETICVSFPAYTIASYDETGATGYRSSYVLEAGDILVYAGTAACDEALTKAGMIVIPEAVLIEELQEALAPVQAFDRLIPGEKKADGTYEKAYAPVPLQTVDIPKRRRAALPAEIPYTGDQGYKLSDVVSGKITMDEFIAQIPDANLFEMIRGEGMNSPKVTPGTGGAYAGVTEELRAFGIPLLCCTDGPSGIRMDSGAIAFSMPNNTLMACSFDPELAEELFRFEGLELRMNKIEALLGPGMNLHRHALNGRNFEYFSEDPLLTGKVAAAQIRGLKAQGTSGVIKHFATNNQEFRRNYVDAVVSERAVRELYLKGYEIAVKEGKADAVMTTYSPLNGNYTSGNFDLLTTVLRGEWGFEGIAMTDWWAMSNDPYTPGEEKRSRQRASALVRAQNDLYMVCGDAKTNSTGDNLAEALESGLISRAELQRSAKNILKACLGTQAYDRMYGCLSERDLALQKELSESDTFFGNVPEVQLSGIDTILPVDEIRTEKGSATTLQIFGEHPAVLSLELDARSKIDNPLAQLSLTVSQDKIPVETISLTGNDTEWKHYSLMLTPLFQPNCFLRFYFALGGMEIANVIVHEVEDITEEVQRRMSKYRQED